MEKFTLEVPYIEQRLQVGNLLVSQVEETVSGVVGVQAQGGAHSCSETSLINEKKNVEI